MRDRLPAMALMIVAVAGAMGGCDNQDAAGQAREWTTITIRDHTWRVEIVDTPERQFLGLSGREGLAEDEGMLFVFDEPAEHSFCMRQMKFPLDIAFIDADGRIVRTHTMVVEPDGRWDRRYPSYAPVLYALEVNAGSFAKVGIDVGDQATIGD